MTFYRSKTMSISAALLAMLAAAGAVAAKTADCSSPLTVKSGDTLSGIAQRCGTSVSALLTNNPQVDESGAVRIGEKIYLPPLDSLYSDAQLNLLLGPIALHPDVLLSEMLPASTYPLEIVQAARWLESNPHAEAGDEQNWSSSVKALTRYPDVLAQMNEDIEWTQQLGDAFLTQPDAVFETIQRLRRQADAAGHLKDSEQQDVVREKSSTGSETIIRIVHADPLYVHVPRYDPDYVYSHHDRTSHRHTHHDAGIHFGVGLLLGGWLHHTLDWHHGHLFYQPYHSIAYQRYYRYRHYRPYTSYTRHYDYYGRSPYRGLRWRHDQRRYNAYGRTRLANRHYYSGRSQERYRHRYNHNGSYITDRRQRNFSEPVERRRDQRPSNRHDNAAVIGRSNRQGNGERNTRRNPDMNTRIWKGGSAGRDGGLSREQRRDRTAANRTIASATAASPQSSGIANTSRRMENTVQQTNSNRATGARNNEARTSRAIQRPRAIQQARSQQRAVNVPSQVRQQRAAPSRSHSASRQPSASRQNSASRSQPRMQKVAPQRRQERVSRGTNQRLQRR